MKLEKKLITRPFKPPVKKKLMLIVSLQTVHHKPNGSIIWQPGPKVSMTFYHFWPKNDDEKWSRKNIFEIPPCA
jgi:hypothetical protein